MVFFDCNNLVDVSSIQKTSNRRKATKRLFNIIEFGKQLKEISAKLNKHICEHLKLIIAMFYYHIT